MDESPGHPHGAFSRQMIKTINLRGNIELMQGGALRVEFVRSGFFSAQIPLRTLR